MKKTIKKLSEAKDGEIFEFVKPLVAGFNGKMIRLRGSKFNVLCLNSFETKQVNFSEEIRIIGELQMTMFTGKQQDCRFDELFSTAVDNLQEYYVELEDGEIVAAIKERIKPVDTGNNQSDYETIRNQVERLVQNWIIDQRF